MSVELEKNTYGLSEGVFKACQFLGLEFMPEILKDFFKTCQLLDLEFSPEILKKLSKECQSLNLKFSPEIIKDFDSSQEHLPSDYFGDDFELDEAMIKKLCAERKWTKKQFEKEYKAFAKKYNSQKCFSKHTKTDLNIYFCDHTLFAAKQNGASISDYFDFEFYTKSFENRKEFRTQRHRNLTRIICNDPCEESLLNNKGETNEFFASFLYRDWIKTRSSTLDDFKFFVEKHSRFFSKPYRGSFGIGAEIINVNSNQNIKKLFENLKSKDRILEEVVKQHEALQAFCPDTINTVRVNTFLDVHNVVHILTTGGRFGRVGKVVDNFHGGGLSVIIDPKTGIIISDGINRIHERLQKHPDTGKIFKGFQYPYWEKLRATIKYMAKSIPQMRHIGWDIAINNDGEIVLIEANINPDVDVQQAPDDTGRLYLYTPLLEEIKSYKWEQMKLLGWRVNNLRNFDSSYNTPSRKNSRLKLAMSKLIPDCTSLMNLGCRDSNFIKSICPKSAKYYPVDYKKHYEEVIVCEFNRGEFPDIKADTILCAFTAEYVEPLPQFLAGMCNAAQKQILMLCRPISEKEITSGYRWEHPFLTDFTEEFLIKTMEQNDFKLNAQYPMPNVASIILYDFRKV